MRTSERLGLQAGVDCHCIAGTEDRANWRLGPHLTARCRRAWQAIAQRRTQCRGHDNRLCKCPDDGPDMLVIAVDGFAV